MTKRKRVRLNLFHQGYLFLFFPGTNCELDNSQELLMRLVGKAENNGL
jgi:hypothetical protein